MQNRNVCIVIPAFNEGPVIGDVVTAVRAVYPNVVLIDDCSSDETGKIALAAGAVVLRHPINLGQGAALQTGFRYAISRETQFIVTFDADGQHQVEDVAVLLQMQHQTGADVVIGSRFLGTVQNMPPLRRIVLKLAVIFTRITSGAKLTDAHNGLRLFTGSAAEQIHISQNRMAHASEIIDQIHKLGLKVAEAPVTIVYTEYSLKKGQELSNSFNILAELIIARLN